MISSRARNSAPANGGIINSKLPLTQSKQMLLHTKKEQAKEHEMKEGETMAEFRQLYKCPLHPEDGSVSCLLQTDWQNARQTKTDPSDGPHTHTGAPCTHPST